MVNVVTAKKYSSFNRKASLTNMHCMQEKVAAMRLADSYNEDANANSLVNQEKTNMGERN